MKIKWLGHASFLITTSDGKKIVTDPYTAAAPLTYSPVNESADIVTVSHGHGDHSDAKSVKGNPTVLKEAGSKQVKGIDIKGVASHHDTAGGSQRGNNVIFCFAVDGLKVCHLGDLGHTLDSKAVADIGPVDVLMVPVGGTYTVDAAGATTVAASLKPKITIPMHYKTPKCGYPIAPVDGFLQGKDNVKKPNASEIEIQKGSLPAKPEIVVLQPAL